MERGGDPGAWQETSGNAACALPGDPSDKQARYIEAAVGGVF